jgi:hypothetical protein
MGFQPTMIDPGLLSQLLNAFLNAFVHLFSNSFPTASTSLTSLV